MTRSPNVSMEFIKIGAKTHLPLELEGVIEQFRNKADSGGEFGDDDVEKLSRLFKKSLGIECAVGFHQYSNMMSVQCFEFHGHSGSTPRSSNRTPPVVLNVLTDELYKSTIDLEKLRVTGFFSTIPFILHIPTRWLRSDFDLTIRELVAIILHEVGHVFFGLATIGEYVWLNYYLTDGAEILLGKKPNKYKVDILNLDVLAKRLKDQETLGEFNKHPTDVNARKVLLAGIRGVAREQFSSQLGLGSYKRNEQVADLFPVRLGYGRDLVTGLDKLNRTYGVQQRYYKDRGDFIKIEALKVSMWLVSLAIPPFWPVTITALLLGDNQHTDIYDNSTERIMKIRRDLIAQIRDRSISDTQKVILGEDIAAIDNILKGMNQYRTALETVFEFIFPTRRRGLQQLRQEERLERLLNNDLFLTAQRMKQLT